MLPIKTTEQDVDGITAYLKTKATGATQKEAKATIEARLLDSRKLTAYETWGFVTRDGERIKLTERGRQLSRVSGPEQKRAIYRSVVAGIRPYRLAAEWMFHSRFERVTTIELAAHWHEHASAEVGTENETSIRERANAFFNVAQTAGLGQYVIGRAGHQTRFEIDRSALGQFIAEMDLSQDSLEPEEVQGTEARPMNGAETAAIVEPEQDGSIREVGTDKISAPIAPELPASRSNAAMETRVFISHGKNTDIVEQVKTILEVAELPFEVAVDGETTAIPVPDKVLTAMRSCTAAIICVTADEDMKRDDGRYMVNQNVLIEIGAAFVLYDKRVVLVWDRRIIVPSNLQGLYRCEFEGGEMSWATGMKLMQAIKKMK